MTSRFVPSELLEVHSWSFVKILVAGSREETSLSTEEFGVEVVLSAAMGAGAGSRSGAFESVEYLSLALRCKRTHRLTLAAEPHNTFARRTQWHVETTA
jgi:hypothetical protein